MAFKPLKSQKNCMPKITKTAKVKKVSVTKKKTPTKTKVVAVKKKVVSKKVTKKPVTKKAKPIALKKTNHITIDVISDDEVTPNESLSAVGQPFSNWPDFNKKRETVNNETYNETEENNQAPDLETESELESDNQDDIEAYDKQKKFFADWATQNTPKNGEEKQSLAPKKSVGLYRRQAFFYIGATIILLVAVFYLFFSKLTVLILPQGETINDSLTFNISDAKATSTATSTELSDKSAKNIDGDVSVIEVSAEKTYQTTGEQTLGGEEVTGTVNLINKYNKAQALVATTRLLSADGKLFRLKEAVNIPAGGTVSADVYADKPSPEMAITAATSFTIPGLWAGMQTQIYAESNSAFNYQTKVKKFIKQDDLDLAKKDINEVLDLKVKNELSKADDTKIVVYGEAGDNSLVTDFNAKLGDEQANFTVTAKKKIAVITFSKARAASLAEARLSLLVPDDKQLFNFDKNKINYTLDNFDEVNKVATVKALFNASMSLRSDSSLIDRKKLVGLNRSQLSQYLSSFPEIKSYELVFSPSFISNAPTLPDKINIQIKNAQ
jgi:hypothetical protein